VGAYLLAIWGVPNAIEDAAAYHHPVAEIIDEFAPSMLCMLQILLSVWLMATVFIDYWRGPYHTRASKFGYKISAFFEMRVDLLKQFGQAAVKVLDPDRAVGISIYFRYAWILLLKLDQ
jgi:hypothetical protein